MPWSGALSQDWRTGGTRNGVRIARSLTRTAIAVGLKTLEGLFAIARAARWFGTHGSTAIPVLGRACARVIIPCYRLAWTFRRVTHTARRRGIAQLIVALTSRTTAYAAFVVIILVVATQSIHAREYGGFVGAQPLLRQFVVGDLEEVAAEVVAGPAPRVSGPTFRAASVQSGLTPTVLGATVAFQAPPPTAGFAIVQPVLTDTAVEDSGRKGVTSYTVEEGDTPSTIAERFGLRTTTILWANSLTSWSLIRPGQTLVVLPTDGIMHTVKRGETLEKIAARYRADAEETLEFNRLVDADDINVGDVLIVPGGKPPAVIAPPAPARVIVAKPLPSIPGKFFWPSIASYRISQYFSWRHHGVDIAVAHGTPVYASDPGTVKSSGWISGYGYQVTIDHGNGLQTRYAHNSKLLVAKGQQVERGQQIALVGSTGRSTGPHIHFEVFANGVRVNPFQYLR